jgi:hypothetical protein
VIAPMLVPMFVAQGHCDHADSWPKGAAVAPMLVAHAVIAPVLVAHGP